MRKSHRRREAAVSQAKQVKSYFERVFVKLDWLMSA